MATLFVLADPNRLGWNIAWSKLGAAEIALVNNFVWNEVWTFKALTRPSVARLMKLGAADVSPLHLESGKSPSRLTSAATVQRFKARMIRGNLSQPMGVGRGEGFPRLRRFLLFNAICGMGILFAIGLLHLFHTRFGWNLYLSNLLTIGLVTLWNFGMNARFNWGWRNKLERPQNSFKNLECTARGRRHIRHATSPQTAPWSTRSTGSSSP